MTGAVSSGEQFRIPDKGPDDASRDAQDLQETHSAETALAVQAIDIELPNTVVSLSIRPSGAASNLSCLPLREVTET